MAKKEQSARFHAGTLTDGWKWFGAHPAEKRGKTGWEFRVWAPHAKSVSVVGDFNDWNNNLSDLLRKTLRVKEVFDELSGQDDRKKPFFPGLTGKVPKPLPARTFPALFPFFRLDRIYVRGFMVNSASVMQGAPWTALSDHVPLVASLRTE